MASADNITAIETFHLGGDQSVPLPAPLPHEKLAASLHIHGAEVIKLAGVLLLPAWRRGFIDQERAIGGGASCSAHNPYADDRTVRGQVNSKAWQNGMAACVSYLHAVRDANRGGEQ